MKYYIALAENFGKAIVGHYLNLVIVGYLNKINQKDQNGAIEISKQIVKHYLVDVYTNICVVLKIILVMPVSVVSAETKFR